MTEDRQSTWQHKPPSGSSPTINFTSMAKICLLVASIVAAWLTASSAASVEQLPFVIREGSDCSNYQGLDSCQGQQTEYPEDQVADRRWQTPPRNHARYTVPQWQSYRDIQGYAHVEYSADHKQATVQIKVRTRVPVDDQNVFFKYGNGPWNAGQSSQVVRSLGMDIGLYGSNGLDVQVWVPSLNNATLKLDPLYFVWQNEPVDASHTQKGQRYVIVTRCIRVIQLCSGAIIELFGWPYNDVKKECETFLGKAGYLGVKIFPPQEHVESYHYLQRGELNPWYFSYQPVSYRLISRLGSREELRSMIQTCRKHGVRIYADAVINHMSGGGNDVNEHRMQSGGSCVTWGPKNASAGSPFFTHSWTFEQNPFTGKRPALEYPAVPYGPEDFHCERPMNDWASGFSLNYGWLAGLADLNTERPFVQQRIADYLTELIGLGFSGFRIDAAKHIRPDDLAKIFGQFRQNMGKNLPDDFISWLEVIIGGEKGLLACDENPYNYYTYLDKVLAKEGFGTQDIAKIKIWSSDYPKEHPICGHWILPSSRFAIQNDDHDQQNPGSSSRDMGDKGSILIKERNVERHRMFEQQLFDRTDGDWSIRIVLSGYTFMENGAQGYPDGLSDCSKYIGTQSEPCQSVPFQPAFRADSCGYSMIQDGKWQEGSYTRVHRDVSIVNSMRRWVGLASVANSDLGLSPHC